MVLPGPIFVVKGAILALSLWLTIESKSALKKIQSAHVTQCSLGPPSFLLAYRLLAFFYCLAIGISQVLRRGPHVFVFFTVWNWTLLTLYFGLASIASIRAGWWRAKRGSKGHSGRESEGGFAQAGTLERAVVVLYHVEAPVVWVVDVLTWTVLVPMLMATPDEDKRAYWRTVLFNFTSYNQHGFNAALVLGEAVLNCIPTHVPMFGYLGLWSSLFNAWSTLFYWKFGRFIYPFLDAHRPYAWAAYLGLGLTYCAAYLWFLAIHRAKAAFLKKLEGTKERQKISPKAELKEE